MFSIPVLAEAESKLHADIALIRLLRTGIRAEQISAFFPRGRAPNTVCCCLSSFHHIPSSSGLPMAGAGIFGRLFRRGTEAASVDEQLERLGLSAEMMKRLVEKMEDGRTVICVHARNEAEAAVAWHIFQHVGAEHIISPTEYAERVVRDPQASTHPLAEIAA